MNGQTHTTVLTWGFLRAIAWAAVALAMAVLVGGALLGRGWGFALTFGFAFAVDLGISALVVHDARIHLACGGTGIAWRLSALVGARLALKAVLLAAAAFMPGVLDFIGMVLGVLLVDTTILVVGSIIAAARTIRHGRTPPRGNGPATTVEGE